MAINYVQKTDTLETFRLKVNELFDDVGDLDLLQFGDSSPPSIVDSVNSARIENDATPSLGGDLNTNGYNILFGDNEKAIFGDGSDLEIYHDGSNSFINDSGTGTLQFQTGGNTKLEITGTGIDITGTVVSDGLTVDGTTSLDGASTTSDISFEDNTKALFGTGSDLEIYHDGSNSFINDSGTGTLQFQTGGNTKLEITATGIDLSDDDKITLGSDSDFEIYHQSSDGTSRIETANNQLILDCADSVVVNANVQLEGKIYNHSDTDSFVEFGTYDQLSSPASSPEITSLRVVTDGTECLEISDQQIISSIDVSAPNFNSTSDLRLKENIEKICGALEKVSALDGVIFNFKNETEKKIGLIAQNVEAIIPEAVSENKDGFKTVAYGNIVGLLIEAIKEQQSVINSIVNKLDEQN